MQNVIGEFPPQRARGYSSLVDVAMMKKGIKWKTMKDSYVIVHFSDDPFGEGKPMYVFERKDENGKPFNDGTHIIFVNGEYMDLDTDIGKLNHDLKCKNADEMIYNEFRDVTKAYKTEEETDEGEKKMLGKVVEELCDEVRDEGRQEGRQEGRIDGAINTAKSLGITGKQLVDTVVKSCNTTEAVVKDYLSKMNMK